MVAVFACAMLSILLAVTLVFVLFRSELPVEGWKMLAALSATWTGGSANLVAVKQSIGLPDNLLPPVLLADALCYSLWVVVLFSAVRFAPASSSGRTTTATASLLRLVIPAPRWRETISTIRKSTCSCATLASNPVFRR